ncbi:MULTISPECIES: hypothetical protein [Sphingobacterium]|uniref:hypothetical protein n=1 Tax=Sphingobacterium TaxID=28453 RepID=UPI002579EEAB|nr:MULTISPECIES: hypothetical protein [Sphingobacterium]
MKTLVKTFTLAALMAVSTFAMAAEGPGSKSNPVSVNLSTADFALEHYVAVITEGESAGIEQLKSYSRYEVVKSLKKQKNIHLDCAVSTDVVEQSTDYMVARVTLKFENFTKTDLVTLVREGKDWRVSKSINSYK